jgi:hypothetical protein
MSDRRPARPRSAGAARFLAALCLSLCASVGHARAATFNDVMLDLGLRDDARIFLNVANDYFAPPPAVAVELVRNSPVPEDDFPVILYLARASKRQPREILRPRADYLSWSDTMDQLNIPPSVLFNGIDRDPGPPYGKAWGYWRKHQRDKRITLRDRDVVELAKLQIAARSQRVSPYTIAAVRQKGITVEEYVAGKNRGKYPKSKGAARGKDKGKEHGKPHGHD